MKSIIVGFSKPKKTNIISSLIMKIEKVPFSHTYMTFSSESLERTLIYQANRHGVWFIGNDKFKVKNTTTDRFLIELTDDQYKKILQKCVDLCGEEYGFLPLVGLGVVEILEKYGIKSKNPLTDKHNYICSKLMATVLETIDPFDVPKDLDEITPKDLYWFLRCYIGSAKVIYMDDDIV